jgi:hypothetical protein
MLKAIASLALLAALAPAASAQTGHGDAEAAARIRVAIDRAASAGVPAWLLENKVLEGRAKGIPAARIAAAVEHRADVLARVRAALADRQPSQAEHTLLSAGELTAAATAHELGVKLEDLAAISARAGSNRGAALAVLADLVARGRASENALMRVQAALARGNRGLDELRKAEIERRRTERRKGERGTG